MRLTIILFYIVLSAIYSMPQKKLLFIFDKTRFLMYNILTRYAMPCVATLGYTEIGRHYPLTQVIPAGEVLLCLRERSVCPI